MYLAELYISFAFHLESYLTWTFVCLQPNVSPTEFWMLLSLFNSAPETCSFFRFPSISDQDLYLLRCYVRNWVTPFCSLPLALYIQLITRCFWFYIQISNWISIHPPHCQLNCHYTTANRFHLSQRPLISGSDSSFPGSSLSHTFSAVAAQKDLLKCKAADYLTLLLKTLQPCLILTPSPWNWHAFLYFLDE